MLLSCCLQHERVDCGTCQQTAQRAATRAQSYPKTFGGWDRSALGSTTPAEADWIKAKEQRMGASPLRSIEEGLGWIRRARQAFFVGSICIASGVAAVPVENLYSAQVDVASQSASDRETAIRNALGAVLVKLTGDRDAAKRPEAQLLLKQADRYVEQYQYSEKQAPNRQAGQGEALWVGFDANAVSRSLQDSGLPVWGRNRPYLIVWIGVEESGRRYLIEPGTQSDLREAVDAAAAARGLPVLLPLMDLEDQAAIDVADVWGNFTDRIAQASSRYRANGILVGRIHKEPTGQWRSRWSLDESGNSNQWDARSGSLREALTAGIDGTADVLAHHYAQVLTVSTEELTFAVEGVDSTARYTKVLRYLESLESIAAVRVAALEGSRIVFRLRLRTDRDGLGRSLALGDFLVPVGGGATVASPNGQTQAAPQPMSAAVSADLVYRVVP